MLKHVKDLIVDYSLVVNKAKFHACDLSSFKAFTNFPFKNRWFPFQCSSVFLITIIVVSDRRLIEGKHSFVNRQLNFIKAYSIIKKTQFSQKAT